MVDTYALMTKATGEITSKLKRKISVCDSSTIAVPKKTKSPVITGDKDLRTAAEKENVEIIW